MFIIEQVERYVVFDEKSRKHEFESPTEGEEKVRYSCNLFKLVQIPIPTRVLRPNGW